MRCWSTPDGGLLVERNERMFLLYDGSAVLRTMWSNDQGLTQVENGELVLRSFDKSTEIRNVELSGLKPAVLQEHPAVLVQARAFPAT